MSLTRVSAAVLCAALALVATHADAKSSKPVARSCAAVTDPAGDANGINPGAPFPASHAGPSNDVLDILRVDAAAGRSTMQWVLQVERLAVASPSAPTGMFWSVHFTIRKTTFTLNARSTPNGFTFDGTYASATGGGRLGPMFGVLDTARNEVRFILQAATLAKLERAPLTTKITGIGATTGQQASTSPIAAANTVDWTTTPGTITPGKPARC